MILFWLIIGFLIFCALLSKLNTWFIVTFYETIPCPHCGRTTGKNLGKCIHSTCKKNLDEPPNTATSNDSGQVIQSTTATDELVKLATLLDKGHITQEEFEKQKEKILA